jgi:hypothetical protein
VLAVVGVLVELVETVLLAQKAATAVQEFQSISPDILHFTAQVVVVAVLEEHNLLVV